MTWVVPPIFAGKTVAVLASGPSMSQAIADRVRHLPRIAINNTGELAPDADILFAGDSMWWQEHPEALSRPGIKATVQAVRDIYPNVPAGVRVLRNTGTDGFDPHPGCLRTHTNSGAMGIQIAGHAKAARILLLGFDMHGGHWHAPHAERNPSRQRLERWVVYMESLKVPAEVINCTPGSALTAFPMADLDDVLEQREAA